MKLENRCLVPANRETVWNLIIDLPRVAPCIPGLSALEPEGEGRYAGSLLAQAGPMRVNLAGRVQVVALDAAAGAARFLLEAADRRLGGAVRTTLTLHLTPVSAAQTELTITTDTAFMGALGTLGQPIIRRKAAAAVAEFARRLADLAAESGEATVKAPPA